jgi:CheY-like chemotaxis protein
MPSRAVPRPTVLVVDDDLPLRVLATITLARAGYSPVAVGSGVRALERFAAGGVDVVVTDLLMSGVDGFDVIRALRATRAAPTVLAMTGSGDEAAARAIALGARQVLRKPFDPDELPAAVAAALENAPLAA